MSDLNRLFPFMAYIRDDDYDPPDVEWLSYTEIGCPYEVEIDLNRSGNSRWRDPRVRGPWKRGEPPKEDA